MDIEPLNLPRFERAPVVETALGVQFAPIADFTAGHYGWFWKRYLDATWVKAQDAPRLSPQFEKFSEQGGWQVLGPPLVFQSSAQPERILFVNDGGERIIQLQNDRFHYNWRKRGAEYPSFARIYPEFRRNLQAFDDFVREAGLDAPLHNLWEFTYFNNIPKGDLWNSPSDWAAILPGLFGRIDAGGTGLVCESSSGMLKFEIPEKRGRVYIVGQHAKIEGDEEVLQVNLTARGPVIAGDEEWDLTAGMAIGHAALVRIFHSIVSPAARSHWGER